MTENVPDAAVQTITYKRQAHKRKRADLLAALPAEEVHHELGDKHCPDCHHELIEIGKQSVRQELLFIPAQLKRLDHIQHAYKCKYCSQRNLSDKIIKAAVPKAPLNHGLGSASLIAHSLYQKYEMKLPDYRQESDWKKMGLEVSRQMLNYWGLKSSEYYFKPMFELLKQKLLTRPITRPILHADETYYTVLESETIKTYYWVFLSGKHDPYKITLYHHDPSRSGKVALNFLGDYPGYLHCDMWQAYEQLPKATLVGCWAHVRRKFHEAVPQTASGKSLAQKGVNYCNRMFYLEQTWENLSKQARYQLRQEKLKPLMQEFFNWCEKNKTTVLPGSKLGKAIILSLIETAKRNGLDPEKYLNYLLQKLPNEEILDSETLEAYLPWQEKIQINCK